MTDIHIAAAAVVRSDGAVLLVRKRGTQAFMQPGGKIEPGESPRAALRRELAEEIGLDVPEALPAHLGRFTAPAAHEPGLSVSAEVFRLDLDTDVIAQAEIAEIRWLRPGESLELAPLTRDHILPRIWG